MMTPSIGIDQNGDKKFIDKYWGRVPKYLHIIPETIVNNKGIYECNPEYMQLIHDFMDGTIDERNLSQELMIDIENTINEIPNYGSNPNPELDPLFSCMFD